MLRTTDQPVDTLSVSGNVFPVMMGIFAEFETYLHGEHHMEGITAVKARDVYRGRKSLVDPAKIIADEGR